MNLNRISTAIEALLFAGNLVIILSWFMGRPVLYSPDEPVMSIFTAISLFIMVGNRLARKYLYGWPATLSVALTGLVIGGNLSSILIHTTMPAELMLSFDVVLTSVITSIGLSLFCIYDLLIRLRKTPQSTLIIDDILLHLALVPGGISLLGFMLENPTYMSMGIDPRVGISLLDMLFMAAYACTAVLSNRDLFLWQFLLESWANRIVFIILFINQFVTPLLVAALFFDVSRELEGPGLELFALFAGVIATVSFLSLQAYLKRRDQNELQQT